MNPVAPQGPSESLDRLPDYSSEVNGTGFTRTRVDTRSSRSWQMHTLQSSVKPFGSWLIRPKSPQYGEGNEVSPELRAPESVFSTCNVRQIQIGAGPIRMYQINDRASPNTRDYFIPAQVHDLRNEQVITRVPSRHLMSEALEQVQTHETESITSKDFASHGALRKHKHIYYFAGGSWQASPSIEHWKFCSHLAHTLTSRGHPTTVSLVSHPLAPRHPADASLRYLENWYYEILPTTPPNSVKEDWPSKVKQTSMTNDSEYEGENLKLSRSKTKRLPEDEEVIFAGDSSGGNIALALPLMVLSRNQAARAPDQLLLISPAVDMRNTNPEIAKIDKYDPILGLKQADRCAKTWTGHTESEGEQTRQLWKNMAPDHPYVSPLLGDIAVLERKGVVVNGVSAGYDVLAPDTVLLREKCQRERVVGSWLEWDKQMHCFPLAFTHTKLLPESKEGMEWILDRLMEEHAMV